MRLIQSALSFSQTHAEVYKQIKQFYKDARHLFSIVVKLHIAIIVYIFKARRIHIYSHELHWQVQNSALCLQNSIIYHSKLSHQFFNLNLINLENFLSTALDYLSHNNIYFTKYKTFSLTHSFLSPPPFPRKRMQSTVKPNMLLVSLLANT